MKSRGMMKKMFIVFREDLIQIRARDGDLASFEDAGETARVIAKTETLPEAEAEIEADIKRESDLSLWDRHIATCEPDSPEGRACYFVTEAYVMTE